MICLMLLVGLGAEEPTRPPSTAQAGKYGSLTHGARPPRLALAAWPALLEDLVGSQADDGGWGGEEDPRLGITATALLAFLQSGVTTWAPEDCPLPLDRRSSVAGPWPRKDRHRILRRGIDYILRQQGPDGFIGRRETSRSLRDHALAATVLSEAYRRSWLPVLRFPAEQAILTLEAESFPSTRKDAEAVGWIVLALRSAMMSSLPFDRALYDRLSPNLRSSTGGAIELLVWTQLGWVGRLPPDLRRAPTLTDLPSGSVGDRFWGTKALLAYDGPEGPLWRRWKRGSSPVLPKEDVEATALRALTDATTSDSWIFGLK